MRLVLAALLCSSALGISSLSVAAAADDSEPPPDAAMDDVSATFAKGAIDSRLDLGTSPDSPEERLAVRDYLAGDANDALNASDVVVGTLPVTDAVEVTMVAPAEGPNISEIEIEFDAETESLSVESISESPAAIMSTPAAAATSSWIENPVYTVEYQVLVDDISIGTSTYQTKSRYRTDVNGADLWEVRRRASADPGRYPVSTAFGTRYRSSTASKIWISNDISENGQYANAWDLDLTLPRTNSSVCDQRPELATGPWSFSIHECQEYHPWKGNIANRDIGHYRISYDQGAISNTGMRDLSYKAAWYMKKGVRPGLNWYSFTTFRLTAPGDSVAFSLNSNNEFKCNHRVLGTPQSQPTLSEQCVFDYDDATGREATEYDAVSSLKSIDASLNGWHLSDTNLAGPEDRAISTVTIGGAERGYENIDGYLFEISRDQSGALVQTNTGVYIGIGSPISATYVSGAWGRVYVNINGALHEVQGDASGWHIGDTGIRVGAGSPISATYVGGAWGRIYVNINGALHEVQGDGSGWHMGDTGLRIGSGSPIAATYVSGAWGRVYVNTGGALHEAQATPSGWYLGNTGVSVGSGSPIAATYINGAWGRVYANSNGAVLEVFGDSGGWHVGDTGMRVSSGSPIAATYISGSWGKLLVS